MKNIIRIEVDPQEFGLVTPRSIEGFVTCESFRDEIQVIKLIRNGNKGWSVGSSMCLPSSVSDAKTISDCMNKVFKKLADIEG